MTAGFKRHHGGDTVRYGFYWNLGEWEAQIVPKEGAELKARPPIATSGCLSWRCSCSRR